jgi:hypothetical protein
MISIIIASVRKELLKTVSQNIFDTIGIPYEIISTSNSDGKKGLCEIYNLSVKEAKYKYICFMHEDIEIKTNNWGIKIIDAFEHNEKLGVLGIAGSSYKAFAPSGWGIGAEKNTEVYNYLQRFKDLRKLVVHAYLNANQVKYKEVVTVDGMWFCTKREIAVANCFDERTFKGFHCYDLDFCFSVGKTNQIAVTFDILLEHFSEGGYNKDWFFETLKLHRKWEKELPKSLNGISQKVKNLIEKRAYTIVIARLVEFGFNKPYILDFINEYREKANMSFWLYIKLRYKLNKLLTKQIK